MLKGAAVLAAGAGCGLLGNLLTSHYMSPDSYGRLTALLSLVSILSVLASLGFPWYFLANQNLYLAKRRKYILVVFSSSLCAVTPLFYFMDIGSALGGGALLVATSLSLLGVLDAQVQRQQVLAALMQSLPALCKGVSAAVLAAMIVLGFDGGRGGDYYYSTLFFVSVVAVVFFSIFSLCRSVPRKIQNLEGSAARVSVGSVSAYLGSAVLSLSYNMALPPIVAYFFGVKLAAFLGIYQIFWSINSLLLTAFVNNKIAPVLLSERRPEIVSSIWKNALKYSLAIGLFSVLVSISGAFIGEATIWSSYSGLGQIMVIGSLALFVRSFSAAYGVKISAASFIRKKMWSQAVVFVLMVVIIIALSGSELGPIGLLLIVLFLEGVLLFGYWFIGRSSFRK